MTISIGLPKMTAPRQMVNPVKICDVCGGQAFQHTPVLWPALIAEWKLSPYEAEYIDVQQGTHCGSCGANIRSIALARAIMRFRQFPGTLSTFVADPNQHDLRVLEINEAGSEPTPRAPSGLVS